MERVAPELVGPHEPMEATPTRRPLSVRRTTTIDTTRAEALSTVVRLDVRGRDLFTDQGGTATEVAVDTAVIDVDSRTVTAIAASPASPGLDGVAGASVGNRFRNRVAKSVPDLHEQRPLLAQLLDDVVGASVVNGYALQRAGIFDTLPVKVDATHLTKVTNVCAGWADTATILNTVRDVGEIPTPFGPPAPPVTVVEADPLAWHDLATLTPHAMRRLRRLDVYPAAIDPDDAAGATHGFDVHFRDTHVDAEGTETVLHEYHVTGSVCVDPGGTTGTIVDIAATAHVLPWVECPQAIGSERRLVGQRLGTLREMVLAEFSGTTTCTHLNDTLRSLAGLEELIGELDRRTR